MAKLAVEALTRRSRRLLLRRLDRRRKWLSIERRRVATSEIVARLRWQMLLLLHRWLRRSVRHTCEWHGQLLQLLLRTEIHLHRVGRHRLLHLLWLLLHRVGLRLHVMRVRLLLHLRSGSKAEACSQPRQRVLRRRKANGRVRSVDHRRLLRLHELWLWLLHLLVLRRCRSSRSIRRHHQRVRLWILLLRSHGLYG